MKAKSRVIKVKEVLILMFILAMVLWVVLPVAIAGDDRGVPLSESVVSAQPVKPVIVPKPPAQVTPPPAPVKPPPTKVTLPPKKETVLNVFFNWALGNPRPGKPTPPAKRKPDGTYSLK